MKSLDVGQIDLAGCVSAAQNEPIVVTQAGTPIALILGVSGLDAEQIELGSSAEFWNMIQARRQQPTISRNDLLTRIDAVN
jgi:antitoxin (DNA-binding transcriptional repressor) of toxin-antitoxin stability system